MDINQIEKALIKRYRQKLYTPFIRALQKYALIKEGDTISVCISGGKDSFTLAKLLQILQRYSEVKFNLKYIAMDPGFTSENKAKLMSNAKALGLPLIIKDSNIYAVACNLDQDKPCYMCSRMRRGFLYRVAQEEGCNKIALAHHFDDVVETILLNMFYGGVYQTMMPKIKAKNYPNMELIRPLYFVKEKDIQNFINYSEIEAISCGCPLTEKSLSSKRAEVKSLLKDLSKINKNIPMNIFRSAENVNLNAALKWKIGTDDIDFCTRYDELDFSEE